MPLYVKKPDTIEAIQWDGSNHLDVFKFCGRRCHLDGARQLFVDVRQGCDPVTNFQLVTPYDFIENVGKGFIIHQEQEFTYIYKQYFD